ncbi:MAG: hypothetical protein R6V02_11335, partial [Candidatus Aminicenantes bacterium]
MMSDLHWKTAVSDVKPNKILIRGYPLDQLMGKVTFSQGIYLVLKGEMPSLYLYPAARTVNSAHGVEKEHGNTPEGDKLETALGQGVV